MQSEITVVLRQWDRDQNSEPDWHHDELERIAGMVREGYTSGEIVGRNEEPGWWKLKHADEGEDRTRRAYAERAMAAVALARMCLMAGYAAGVGQDDKEDSDPEWRVVLYAETPMGQVSWHIAPEDQWLLEGLPKYEKPWDGTFRSRDGSFAVWSNGRAPV